MKAKEIFNGKHISAQNLNFRIIKNLKNEEMSNGRNHIIWYVFTV